MEGKLETLTFDVVGECVPKGRPKFSTNGRFVKTYTPEKTANYENLVKVSCLEALKNSDIEPFMDKSIALGVIIRINKQVPSSVSKKKREGMLNGNIRPTTKPDLDNCVKSILDALNGVAYLDDSQVTSVYVSKFYAEVPYTHIDIFKFGGQNDTGTNKE